MSKNDSIVGKTVEIADLGRGTIIGCDRGYAEIMLDGDGCKVLFVPVTALEVNEDGE